MSGKIYLKNKMPCILLNILFVTGLSLFLFLNGNSPDTILFILCIWIAVLVIWLSAAYRLRKSRLEHLLALTEQLEERYLLPEVMEKPERADDLVYYQILKRTGKSMLEHISRIKRERLEYKEYIEKWIHEIKTPITAIGLLCENNRSPLTQEMMIELERINRFTEQALYYARSEQTEKDYSVREIHLPDVIHQAIADNKHLLLQNHVKINLEEAGDNVYSDDKWIRFILNQLIVNSVKYGTANPVITFRITQNNGDVILSIQDNGIGISSSDLPRIFEKGFTGENGRSRNQSTGMGLYLCKRLCDKLGISILADSNQNGTTIQLVFSINYFIHQVQGG